MNETAYRIEIKTDLKIREKYIELKGPEPDKAEPISLVEIPDHLRDEETNEDIPVRVLGNHAFSSRKDISEVKIPDTVHTILGFAFHNCGNLRRIFMTDSVREYLDGGTRQCENLKEIDIHIKQGNYGIIRRILEDNDRRLAFRLHMPDGEALLVFPGFVYDFVENTMARTIQFAIEGTGYAYRECVKQDIINIREYDNLFSKVAADDRTTAEQIAVSRIKYPYMLTEDSENVYLKWLRENAHKNLIDAINEKPDVLNGQTTEAGGRKSYGKNSGDFDSAQDKLEFYRKRELIPMERVPEIIDAAVNAEKTTMVSVLMDYQKSFERKDSSGIMELDF